MEQLLYTHGEEKAQDQLRSCVSAPHGQQVSPESNVGQLAYKHPFSGAVEGSQYLCYNV